MVVRAAGARLRRLADVPVMQATDFGNFHDPALSFAKTSSQSVDDGRCSRDRPRSVDMTPAVKIHDTSGPGAGRAPSLHSRSLIVVARATGRDGACNSDG